MSLSELALQKIPPKYKFWRHKEHRFWLGAILADYARITGSKLAEKVANKIFNETEKYMLRKLTPTKGKKGK